MELAALGPVEEETGPVVWTTGSDGGGALGGEAITGARTGGLGAALVEVAPAIDGAIASMMAASKRSAIAM